MTEADRDARDAAIRALLPLVPARGWTSRAIAAALAGAGLPEEEATFLFPRGAVSAVEAWLDLADREMAEAAGDLSALRTPDRIRTLVAARLRQAAPHKDAMRQATALLALPWNAPAGLRAAARTASAMWYAAGDRSADFSWYTRRASLAAIYGATLAFWLRDDSEDIGPALDFLDRRMADLARLTRCRRRGAAGKAKAA
ncbi:COQ9 family protein [Neoroseomonas soli]|uniref:COQ9 family protein n=1 Tax=Neoroseomonas soli TaxID=1081025 RepID=A0A9X9WSF5_9PROT|nr:COQ9 family protein [Neoroseomonas soli]MBR0670084.1 COQ9 family protein [Neoroseomonas soli]